MQENMKRLNKILHNWSAAAFVLLTASLAACTADPIEMEVGSGAAFDPVGKVKPGFYSQLTTDTLICIVVKPGEKFEDVLTFGLTKEAPKDVIVSFSKFADDADWLYHYNYNVGSYTTYQFDDKVYNMTCAFLPDEAVSVSLGEKVIPAGSYGLNIPVSIDLSKANEEHCQHLLVLEASCTGDDGNPEVQRFYYQLRYDPISMRTFDDYRKKTDIADCIEKPRLPYITVLIDPSWIDPRCVRELPLSRTHREQAAGINDRRTYEANDAVAIWGASVQYNAEEKMPELAYDGNLIQLLRNNTKYLVPIQDDGITVSVIVSGGGMGIGFCNLDDAQRASLVEQIRKMVVRYNLDGVNLYDEASGYGREGMPAIDPASYAKFIRDLRTALGSDKLITLTDVGEPSATLYQPQAGIEAGQYLDYAWTGITADMTDPYADGAARKPIAGLDRSRYGLFFSRNRDYNADELNKASEFYAETYENLDIPRIVTAEVLPEIETAEVTTGIWQYSNLVGAILPPSYSIGSGGVRNRISWSVGESNVMAGSTNTPNGNAGLPGYGNMLYYPDWLRF